MPKGKENVELLKQMVIPKVTKENDFLLFFSLLKYTVQLKNISLLGTTQNNASKTRISMAAQRN